MYAQEMDLQSISIGTNILFILCLQDKGWKSQKDKNLLHSNDPKILFNSVQWILKSVFHIYNFQCFF